MALKVLSALDEARTQLYHFTTIIITGMGFFTDAYDLFCIPPVSILLGRIYYNDKCNNGLLPIGVKTAVNVIALCGAFAGQLFFGWIGDRMGRKKVYGITLTLMFASSIASGFSIGRSRESVIGSLCFFRFWLGFAIGGDYPLSATIMAEYASIRTRGSFIAAVFGMQGLGILAASIVTLIVSASFKAADTDPTFGQKDFAWRIILMLGAVPAAFTFYWRMKMPETARYTALVDKNPRQAANDMSKVLDMDIEEDEESVLRIETRDLPQFGLFSRAFVKHHGLQLAGTTSTWFFVDVSFYSSNLFQGNIYHNIGWLNCKYNNPLGEVFCSAKAQALIALYGTLPGYIFTILLIDRIGRFKIQLTGFFFMSVFMFALAIPFNHWLDKSNQYGFLVIYALTLFFSNFGPNTTTFIVPAELFPTRLRSTCHGISAAAGKAGAIIGVFVFLYASKPTDDKDQNEDAGCKTGHYPTGIGAKTALIILAVASCLGFFCTFMIPETKGRSLEKNEVDRLALSENEIELEPGRASTDYSTG